MGADLQTHSIKDGIAVATAMDMYNMVDDASPGLQIVDNASTRAYWYTVRWQDNNLHKDIYGAT